MRDMRLFITSLYANNYPYEKIEHQSVIKPRKF